MAVELTYCVINTERRQLLRYSLDAIARERATVDFETETLVLDNASHDGSAGAARDHAATSSVISAPRRRDLAGNASELMRLASGRFCLLLAEDSELEPGATAALHGALAARETAAAAGATLVSPDGDRLPSAWRFPGPTTAVLARLRRRLAAQSHGDEVRAVDWAPAAALLVRRRAASQVGWLEGGEIEFCRRLDRAGWDVLYVPEARAVHHEAAR